VAFHDPYAHDFKLEDGTVQKVTPLTPANLRKQDLVVVVTDHSVYDWPMVVRHSKVVLDTRNACRDIRGGAAKVVKL
jgi:UDP-N-acetyl-D-glucosamine dehydrogenase